MGHRLAGYLISAAIGAALALVIGFFAYKSPLGLGFYYWLTRSNSNPMGWAAAGVLIGVGLRYLSLNRGS